MDTLGFFEVFSSPLYVTGWLLAVVCVRNGREFRLLQWLCPAYPTARQ